MIIKTENDTLLITENNKCLFNEKIDDIFKKNLAEAGKFINLTGCEIYVSEKLESFEEYKNLTENEKDKISKEIFEILSNYQK